jgi:hypothetical protein
MMKRDETPHFSLFVVVVVEKDGIQSAFRPGKETRPDARDRCIESETRMYTGKWWIDIESAIKKDERGTATKQDRVESKTNPRNFLGEQEAICRKRSCCFAFSGIGLKQAGGCRHFRGMKNKSCISPENRSKM